MRYFIDTEFFEQGPDHPIQLISLAIVDEKGRAMYARNTDFDWNQASAWLVGNVRPHLLADHRFEWGVIGGRERIATSIVDFIGDDEKPEFWGYYSDYDWVVFCQLFGSMVDLPSTFPYYCRDLRQWLDDKGRPDIKQPDDAIHNALMDAHWVRDTFVLLNKV